MDSTIDGTRISVNDMLILANGGINYDAMRKGKSQSKCWQCFSENYS